jgi:hypothetical protein
MEEGCQKSKRLSYTAKFKREVIRCTEEKGNHKPLQFLELMKARFDWGGNTRLISGCEASRRKFTGPKKGQFPENDTAVFTFFFQDKLFYCIVFTACKAALSFFPKSSSRPQI